MIDIYKIITGVYDRDVTTGLFNLRIDINIFKERPRLEVGKYSFFFQVIDLWNSLPNQVVEAPSVEAIERRLGRYLRGHR